MKYHPDKNPESAELFGRPDWQRYVLLLLLLLLFHVFLFSSSFFFFSFSSSFSSSQAVRIRDAYEILSDPVKVLLYDTGLS